MLENFNPSTDVARRLLYVAMTRAKQNLTIHLNGDYLDAILAENIERVENREEHLPPTRLAMHLSFKDVWLGYFSSRQHLISQLTSGEVLTINSDACTNSKGQPLLKFSRQFQSVIESRKQEEYLLKEVKVNFIVYWQNEDAEHEIKIVLPELIFERK